MSTVQPPADQPSAQQPIEDVYATLAGPVDNQMSQRVFEKGALVVNAKIKRLHLLIQSTGGYVGDGVGIYNYLRNLPVELITYNGGYISSIAVVIYLAGKVRNVSKTAAFMIHKTHFTPTTATTVERLKMSAECLMIDDARTEAILREHVNLPPEKWQIHERGELALSAEESVEFALAHAVGDFKPPPGATIVNV